MADISSFVQSSFLGGLWGPWLQGRIDLAKYRMALNICVNFLPVEEGALVRRPGTRFVAATRSGAAGRVIGWEFQEGVPYTLEFTDGHLRFFSGYTLHVDANAPQVIGVSATDPAIVTLGSAPGWATGDQVQFLFASASPTGAAAVLRNRQFTVTTTGNSEQFSLADAVAGVSLDGSTVGWVSSTAAQLARVTDLPTVWTSGTWSGVRLIAYENIASTGAALVGGAQPVQWLTVTDPASSEPTFAIEAFPFFDGPYQDVVAGVLAAPSGTSGGINLAFSLQGWSTTQAYAPGDVVSYAGANFVAVKYNVGVAPYTGGVVSPSWAFTNAGIAFGPNGAQASDIGRWVRLFYQPSVWSASSSYTVGENVTFDGAYYNAITGSTGLEPDANLTAWQPIASVAFWVPAVVTAVLSATEVSVQLWAALTDTTTITQLQVGLYTAGAYPTCGCFQGGRLWLAGAQTNRIDASRADNIFGFSPSETDGSVTDADAIAITLNAESNEAIQWMRPVKDGILVGTLAREWLIEASSMNDPITPATVDVHPVTKYGGAYVEPRTAGLGTIFVQRYGQQIMEMVANVFSGRYNAPNLALPVRHLVGHQIEELAYQEEPAPVIWARTGDGLLLGCTYRRISAFQTDNPAVMQDTNTFAAWHQHSLGTGRTVTSITKSLSGDGTLDELWAVTAATGQPYWVEALTPIFTATDTLFDAWFLDAATTPTGTATVIGPLGLGTRYYGLTYANGASVRVWAGGLDCGSYTVTDGYVDVPFGSAGGLYTEAYLDSISGSSYGALGVPLDQTVTAPYNPTSTPMTVTAMQPNLALHGLTDNGQGGVDLGNNRILSISGAGIRVYNLNSGEVAEALASAVVPPGGTLQAPQGGGAVIGADGNYYWTADNNAQGWYTSRLAKINPATLTLTYFGQQAANSSSALMASGPSGLNGFPFDMSTLSCNGYTYIIYTQYPHGPTVVYNGTNLGYAGAQVSGSGGAGEGLLMFTEGVNGANLGIAFGVDMWVSHTGAASVNLYALSVANNTITLPRNAQYNLFIGAGYSAANSLLQCENLGATVTITTDQYGALASDWNPATSYVVNQLVWHYGVPWVALVDNTNSEPTNFTRYYGTWALYTTNPNITLAVRGTVQASAIDPTKAWTSFQDVGQIAYDPSDGNVLILATMQNAAGIGSYIAKLRAYDAAVLWFTPVSAFALANRNGLGQCNLANGVLTYFNDGSDVLTVINSQTGAVLTTVTAPGASSGGAYQVGDSVLGRWAGYGSYNAHTAGAPLPAPGSPASFTGWYVLTAGNAFQGGGSSTARYTIPAVIGFSYTSQAQIVRPATQQEAASPTGPVQGELRKAAQFTALLQGTQGVSFGTDFAHLQPAQFQSYINGPAMPVTALFSGVHWDSLDDTPSLEGGLAWQTSGPYPATIVNVGMFLRTEGR